MNYPETELRARVDAVYDDAVAFRRHMHRHPELSEQEVYTEECICRRLDELGIPYRAHVGGHGVVGLITGKDPTRALAIRADIDALPITEAVESPFKSQNAGVMHACGHDLHTSILLGTAQVLQGMKEELPCSVKLFFQPSEETVGGALPMIQDGCMENPKVETVLGLHVAAEHRCGVIEFIPGPMNAASTEFYVTVKGVSTHGAYPQGGIDPLLPACTIVTSLQSVVTRRVDPIDSALVTVGQFHSGTKNNIIPNEVKLSGIIRALSLELRQAVKDEVERICVNTAAAYGATAEVDFRDSYPSLCNDESLVEELRGVEEKLLGKEHVLCRRKPSLGADDFSYFSHGANACYYNLGTAKPGDEPAAPIHNEHFDPDEEAIRVGILTEVAGLLHLMGM